MKEQDAKKYWQILQDYKKYFGLGDWSITLNGRVPKNDGDPLAEASYDPFERTIKVQVFSEFLKKTDKEKKSILVHELAHARLGILQAKEQRLMRDLEEDYVNEITAGFLALEEENGKRSV